MTYYIPSVIVLCVLLLAITMYWIGLYFCSPWTKKVQKYFDPFLYKFEVALTLLIASNIFPMIAFITSFIPGENELKSSELMIYAVNYAPLIDLFFIVLMLVIWYLSKLHLKIKEKMR